MRHCFKPELCRVGRSKWYELWDTFPPPTCDCTFQLSDMIRSHLLHHQIDHSWCVGSPSQIRSNLRELRFPFHDGWTDPGRNGGKPTPKNIQSPRFPCARLGTSLANHYLLLNCLQAVWNQGDPRRWSGDILCWPVSAAAAYLWVSTQLPQVL